ncbi:4-hydroxy-tetrahydrodipicolinate reductase [Anaerotignum sp. MSJ-24]|uniref:4-hydroxy-tetrahydrodipicolinate reductase n=1 Tax=Anaerotignum sp. MSJ-24 TaxID=2841521 RepID=UPI001C124586|nr:4-hydroxy-tetrahydrodipicolinate reductase [Anaerotignum sp. MSJ-24]MBU5464618.1 4-hydroxy-tetrahydrodipicolinate reductase [Anaerotignum sp. MSJ-24]
MTKIIMNGCSGKMGHVVCSLVAEDKDCEIVAGIDPFGESKDFPIFRTPSECNIDADAIIDFSTAKAIPALLDFVEERKIPIVLCTTGLDEELLKKVDEVSKKVAVLKSANMSIGVNLLFALVQKAALALQDSGFDIEIVEKHHNQKIDAPSGTALAIADAINEVSDNRYNYVYDRSQVREKRTADEIGIHAVRGGNIVGEHEVMFAGKDEIIEINHRAMSKEIFAVGAVKAAKYLAGKPAGFYTMKDVLKDILE